MSAEIQKTPVELAEAVMKLQAVMLAMPQIDIPIEHYFAPGIYMRQMTMPEGSTVVGKIHKHEHYCILSKGKVSVVTGDAVKTFEAPAVIHAMPGAKRALHAITETVWLNVHSNPSDERDPEKVDDLFVVDTFDQFLSFQGEAKQIQGGS